LTPAENIPQISANMKAGTQLISAQSQG
jgi:hypothetical protein